LQRAHQHIQQQRFRAVAFETQERQEDECRQPDAHQHGKIAIDVPGKVFANQAKREGPQDCGDDE